LISLCYLTMLCKKGAKSLVLDETMDEGLEWAECN
jgi:hypothetical protein